MLEMKSPPPHTIASFFSRFFLCYRLENTINKRKFENSTSRGIARATHTDTEPYGSHCAAPEYQHVLYTLKTSPLLIHSLALFFRISQREKPFCCVEASVKFQFRSTQQRFRSIFSLRAEKRRKKPEKRSKKIIFRTHYLVSGAA